MIFLFTEIYWSLDEVIIKQYWSVLNSDVNVIIISPIYVFLMAGKMANAIAYQWNNLETKKPLEVLTVFGPRIIHVCQKRWSLACDPVPLKWEICKKTTCPELLFNSLWGGAI